jgi:hypothetical protein
MSVDQVCTAARADTANADASGAASYCSSNSLFRTLSFGLGIGGVVLAGVGVALVMLGPSGSSERQPTATQRALRRVRVNPLLGPTTGLHLEVSF